MKKIFAIIFFISAMCGFAFAQSNFPELEIAKEIKLLGATHKDVIKIMAEFERDEEADEYEYQSFYSDRATVKITFSSGDCSEESAFWNLPDWNVPKQMATKIVITFDDPTKLADLQLDLAGFTKRLQDEEDDEDSKQFIYYNENAGMILMTDDGEIEKIILYPPKKQIGYLCLNENNSDILSNETSFIDAIVDKENYCFLPNLLPSVTALDLRKTKVFGCKDGAKDEKCLNAKKEISVNTTATDAENDVLTYEYTVTGGNIIGQGAEVIWNLVGASPGIYTITAGANDGAGIIGETKARKVLVKENSYEIISPAKIAKLTLDRIELIAACPIGRLKRKLCPSESCGISVATVLDVSGGGNLTYKYKVFYGKIVGSGDHIIWDLSGLKPGKYSIEVSASDDGTVFGNPETATVEIKENPYCSANKN